MVCVRAPGTRLDSTPPTCDNVYKIKINHTQRVIDLKKAVEKADFAAIEAEDGAARLFNSGACVFFWARNFANPPSELVAPRAISPIDERTGPGAFAMNRPLQKKVQAAYADVQKAVKAKVRNEGIKRGGRASVCTNWYVPGATCCCAWPRGNRLRTDHLFVRHSS